VNGGIADSAIFDDYEPGHSVAGDMKKIGVVFWPADKGAGSRAQGWQQMRMYMKSAIPVQRQHARRPRPVRLQSVRAFHPHRARFAPRHEET
jgi:hypothetical protein